ncbi:2Fe-2S iron-sulfur cluster-binding protein [soil metagenome]
MNSAISTIETRPVRVPDANARAVRLRVNGVEHEVSVEPWVSLLDMLREHLHLTGTKKGCDHGQCGACTVLRDGRRINSCLTLAVMHEGADVTTVEGLPGLAGSDALHPLQKTFMTRDAFQCGYCTPGQLCSAAGLLGETPPANAEELRERMSGNLCRCGAYPQIVQAISDVLWPSGAPKVISRLKTR